jgi:hypothetical protein
MPAPATPDPSFPWEDDQAPGLSIRPLGHADLRAFLAEWDDDEPPLRLPPAARRTAEPTLATASQPGRSARASTGAGAPPTSPPGWPPYRCGWPPPSPPAPPSD